MTETKTTYHKSSFRSTEKKGLTRDSDITLGWVERDFPQLSAWRVLAVEWIAGQTRGLDHKLSALGVFLHRYIVCQGLPLDPATFLARTTILPDFYRTACPGSFGGIKTNNHIRDFLDFVLLRSFSETGDDGRLLVSRDFRNPIPMMTTSGLPIADESVRSPLPYGYIDELRQMLASGPHFRDWKFAQSSIGVKFGRKGSRSSDWFEVTESQIDRSDPDCVWRVRKIKSKEFLEMWSPVRWVALLTKLILPLRTFQVRMLDSGESDTWRYEAGSWTKNSNSLAEGLEQRPQQRGVFRRTASVVEGENVSTVLYINSNKTADSARSSSEKGYIMPWPQGGQTHQDIFFWLEKLRNWQEKYNPISRRASWTELDRRHMRAKSKIQLAGYPDTCFLFRLREASQGERHLPVPDMTLGRAWFRLLENLEQRLEGRGETFRDGTLIRFLPTPEEQNAGQTTLFPLHSLRVSLITALALEGMVPFPILQKLAGHSRLLMTLYYTKPGASHIREALLNAAERLEATKEANMKNFLLDTEYNELLRKAICISVPSLAAAVQRHPATRNPAGWMPMHHGLCLAGGNTSEAEDIGNVGGCHNGGPIIANGTLTTKPRHGPVPGGSRNCVRCRWFLTEPHYLPALAAHFNTLAYHFDEARNVCLIRENELQELKKEKADSEYAGQPFARLGVYRQAERVWESAMKRFSDLAEDLVACWRLVERCKVVLEEQQSDGTQLILAGTLVQANVLFEETESELHQLVEVCNNVVIYPDLDPGKAVFRRSQLLDAVLYREGLPPMFMLLSEREQLLAGNAFITSLSQNISPANPVLGQRQVIQLIDAGASLSQYFGVNLASLIPTGNRVQALRVEPQSIAGSKE